MLSLLIIVSCLLCGLKFTHSFPERGHWVATMDKSHWIVHFSKSMFKGSQISVSLSCEMEGEKVADFSLQYIVRRSPCAQEYTDVSEGLAQKFLEYPEVNPYKEVLYTFTEYIKGKFSKTECRSKSQVDIPSNSGSELITVTFKTGKKEQETESKNATSSSPASELNNTNGTTSAPNSSRQKRAAETTDDSKGKSSQAPATHPSPLSSVDSTIATQKTATENIGKATPTHDASVVTSRGTADESMSETPATSITPVAQTTDDNKGKTSHAPATHPAPLSSVDSTIATKKTATANMGKATPTHDAPVATSKGTADESTSETPATSIAPVATTSSSHDKIDHQPMVEVWEDGFYILVLAFLDTPEPPKDFKLKVTVRMMQDGGYISAVDKPLPIFYGIMSVVYIGLSIAWIILLSHNWRDCLSVHLWICAVILLGALENVVFSLEYNGINSTGQYDKRVIILANLVLSLKSAISRILLLITCLGYGIIKPPSSGTFKKVLLLGLVIMVLVSISSCTTSSVEESWISMAISLLLAVTGIILFLWMISSLYQTTRILRLNGNMMNISLFKHFTITLVLAYLDFGMLLHCLFHPHVLAASMAYLIWILTQRSFKMCLTAWKNLWMDVAFWHLRFLVVLCIIMILWRPNANNHRIYAFSPLPNDEEGYEMDDEHVLYKADGVEKRVPSSSVKSD